MTPERWERITELLEKALALPGAEREDFLQGACAEDPEIRREVDSLLASHEEADSSFLNLSEAMAEEPAEKDTRPGVEAGRRIGPYLVTEKIGHGGMGEVFAATRADGQYEKKVALKLVRTGYDTFFVLERFRNERQILASLDHPNIARLLDGGTTQEAIPYLVMELVDGAPIDTYCDAKKLSVTERLQLFRQVCSAVQYAHQHLVIHRDIKPSNILVTKEGIPKLLDFGIAKILDASGSTKATMLRPMTPEYASPEQVRGEAISTQTDVYSLGVVLYQLLTGRSPYRVDTRTPARLAEAITRDEPERPSTAIHRKETAGGAGDSREVTPEQVSGTREATPARLQKRLRGDLDFILLKALRKEPAQRYSSAEQFIEDIRRHLEGIPVAARKGTWSYRSGKFVRRHKASVLAASLIFVTLVTAVVVTVREARIAQRRFNDVRKLANSLMFEVHDSIENIPGATQARKLVVQRSLEYLDKLSKESGNDPDLLRDLATAYRRMGIAQGDPRDPNLGDTKGALASFQKSIQMRESLARMNPKNSQDQEQLAVAYLDFSDFENMSSGNVIGAYQYVKKAQSILDREGQTHPSNVLILTQRFRVHTSLAMMEVGEGAAGRVGTTSDAIADLQKAIEIAHEVIPLSPKDLGLVGQEGIANGLLGEAYLSLGDRPRSIAYYERASEILTDINKKQTNVRAASNIGILEGKIGNALLMDRKTAEALPHYTKAQNTAAQLAGLDPNNDFLRQTKMNSTAELGFALTESGREEEGITNLRDAIAQSQSAPTQTPLMRTVQAVFRTWLAQALRHKGKRKEASQEYATAKDLLGAVRAGGTDDVQTQISFCSAVDGLADSDLAQGDSSKAKAEYDKSLAILEPQLRASPDDQDLLYALAEIYTGEGSASAKLAEASRERNEKMAKWQTARDWFQKSLNNWKKVKNPAWISTGGIETTLPGEVSRRLAMCNQEIESPRVSAK